MKIIKVAAVLAMVVVLAGCSNSATRGVGAGPYPTPAPGSRPVFCPALDVTFVNGTERGVFMNVRVDNIDPVSTGCKDVPFGGTCSTRTSGYNRRSGDVAWVATFRNDRGEVLDVDSGTERMPRPGCDTEVVEFRRLRRY